MQSYLRKGFDLPLLFNLQERGTVAWQQVALHVPVLQEGDVVRVDFEGDERVELLRDEESKAEIASRLRHTQVQG